MIMMISAVLDACVMLVIEDDVLPFISAVARHRAMLTRPSKSVSEYLETLEKQGLHRTLAFLRKHEVDI